MTITESPARWAYQQDEEPQEIDSTVVQQEAVGEEGRLRRRFTPRRVVLLVVLGVVVLIVAIGAVIYGVGPLVHDRNQRALMETERLAIDRAIRSNQGLYKSPLPTEPPVPGSVQGILAIPAIGLQQAVVEGVGSSQTVSGPGHVPGTAGLGQPGNSAVVGRRSGYGGPFHGLGDLKEGDKIVTATTEGQSAYFVQSVRRVTLVTVAPAAVSPVTTTTFGRPGTTSHETDQASHDHQGDGTSETTAKLYGATPGTNVLTLVTSASATPWNSDQAMVVVAKMKGKPYTPTLQESRSPSQQGTTGESSALGWLFLSLLGLGATIAGAVFLYRRTTVRSAYLLTTAPLLAFIVLVAVSASHLLPAWL